MMVQINDEKEPPDALVAMDQGQLQTLLAELARPGGLIIFAGPTFSGKNTVAYLALRTAAARGLSVATIENTVRGALLGVDQFVDDDYFARTDSTPWKRIITQPSLDMLYVRELINGELMNLVIKAAGRRRTKFLSTLHTNDAVQTLRRFEGQSVEAWRTVAAVRLIQAQRRLRRLCTICREEMTCPPGVFEPPRPESVYRACGCSACHGTGYVGSVLACEQLKVDEEFGRLVIDSKPISTWYEHALSSGWRPLRSAALELVRCGDTSLEEALLNTRSM